MTEAKRIPTVDATVSGTVLVLTFSNGETLTVDASALSPDIRESAMLHGLKQKLVDAAAIARNPETGKSATVEDKYNAVREIYDRITSPNGTWNKQRGEGSATSGNTLLLRALMKMTGKTRADIEAFLEGKSKEEKAALRVNPKVAAIIAELQAAASKVDSDDLLSELM